MTADNDTRQAEYWRCPCCECEQPEAIESRGDFVCECGYREIWGKPARDRRRRVLVGSRVEGREARAKHLVNCWNCPAGELRTDEHGEFCGQSCRSIEATARVGCPLGFWGPRRILHFVSTHETTRESTRRTCWTVTDSTTMADLQEAICDVAPAVIAATESVIAGEMWQRLQKQNRWTRFVRLQEPQPLPPEAELAVVTCYFNPCRWSNRRKNFDTFYAAATSQGAEVFVIEAREEGGQYDLPDDLPNLHRVECSSRLWQKERLLNILIERLPRRYTKVAWVDCDVLFDNPDWVADTSRMLDEFCVLQLFESAIWLSPHMVPMRWWDDSALTRTGVATRNGADRSAHPGLAWAGRREWLEKIGLWDQHVLGSGDTVMCYGFFGWDVDNLRVRMISPAVDRLAREWIKAADGMIAGRVAAVPGTVRHLWHGSRDNRHYDDRLLFAAMEDFEPEVHLSRNADGCLEWTDAAPAELVATVRDYFAMRREDG